MCRIFRQVVLSFACNVSFSHVAGYRLLGKEHRILLELWKAECHDLSALQQLQALVQASDLHMQVIRMRMPIPSRYDAMTKNLTACKTHSRGEIASMLPRSKPFRVYDTGHIGCCTPSGVGVCLGSCAGFLTPSQPWFFQGFTEGPSFGAIQRSWSEEGHLLPSGVTWSWALVPVL